MQKEKIDQIYDLLSELFVGFYTGTKFTDEETRRERLAITIEG